MANEVSKRENFTPRPVRMVEQPESPLRDFQLSVIDPAIFSETDKMLKKAGDKALTIDDGMSILQYALENPIIRYESEWLFDKSMLDDWSLNSFVMTISVSKAMYGKRFSVSAGKVKEEKKGIDDVVYYEDNLGVYHSIIQKDIVDFLIQKPKLVVSSEGLLIFYTNKMILATVDCQQYCWIYDETMDTKKNTIVDIEVHNGYCVAKVHNKYREAILQEDEKFKLEFKLDMTARNMIIHKISHM